MKARLYLLAISVLCLGMAKAAAQSISFTIGLAQVSTTEASTPILPSSLFQLVNLGPNGIFDPIEAGGWVSGDDALINLPFANSDGWTSAQAFDASDGAGQAGVFQRQFNFTLGPELLSGTQIGIRWFPTIQASDFATTTTTIGLAYGQFTQLTAPLYPGTTLWFVPGAGSAVDFDQMLTPSFDPEGLNPNSAGVASFSVVPEPKTITLLAACAFVLAAVRFFRPRVR